MKKKVIYNELIGQEPKIEDDNVLVDSTFLNIQKVPKIAEIMADSVIPAPKAHPDNVSGKMKILSE